MRTWSLALLALGCLLLCLGGCAERSELEPHLVAGAEWLEGEARIELVTYEILAHPLTEAELRYFLEGVDALVVAARGEAFAWRTWSEAENPTKALRGMKAWKRGGVSFEDFVAALTKTQFVAELASEPIDIAEIRANAELVERRIAAGTADEALEETARQLRGLERAIEANQAAVDALYRGRELEIVAALQRFMRLGEAG